jgi:3-phosphoshikimate 1-carboxyvinyltransferase
LGVRIAAAPSEIVAESGREGLVPIVVRATDFPDAVPALAALAALAPGESRFLGIAHLRLKESDRIAALAALVTASGAKAVEGEDSLTVIGPARSGRFPSRIPTSGDHRMAMAAALLALRLPGILIQDPACVAKSYPGFFRDLESLVHRRPGVSPSRQ